LGSTIASLSPFAVTDSWSRGDVDGIVNLFADEGVFTIVGNNRETTNKGRVELQKTYKAGLASLTPRP
jgi:hypothetical protein